jgi:hypothetical protein
MYLSVVDRRKFRDEAQSFYESILPDPATRVLTWTWPRWIPLDDTARGLERFQWLERVGHYPEFREFFVRLFSLDGDGLSKSGYIRGLSGMIYSLVFVGRSGEPFPDGLEVYALVDALEPLSEEDVDTDLWAILTWMIQGVGGEWKVEDLDATGRLYQLPFLFGRG